MKEFNKITSKQLAEKGVQALADRPNAHGQYGQGGMSPQQLKIWFDKLATFLAGKINELYGAMSGEDAAYYVRLALDDYEVGSLGDLVESMLSGDFAGRILQVFPSANSFEKVTLQKYIYDIAQKMSTFSEICEESAKGEVDRKNAEEVRKNNELTRIHSEIIRQTEETSRVTNELERISAENSRKRDETERKETVGKVDNALNEILKVQQLLLSGDAELIAKEEVIRAINETLLIADDLETDDPYKALSAAQGVFLKSLVDSATKTVSGWYNGTDSKILELVFPFVPKFVFIAGMYNYDRDEDSRTVGRDFGIILPQESFMLRQSGGNTDIKHTSESAPYILFDGTTVTLDASKIVTTDYSIIFNRFSYAGSYTSSPATRESAYGYRYFAIG